jgi:hypothetical protein
LSPVSRHVEAPILSAPDWRQASADRGD